MIESERPADLDPAELQDYEMVLEEEAFPFEEKAIEVHEKNLELMASGIYNAWIEKSLGELAVLVPGPLREVRSQQWPDRFARRATSIGYPMCAGVKRKARQLDGATESDEPSLEPDSGSDAEAAHEERAADLVEAG